MDCSLPGSSVHGILQARMLEGLPFLPPGDLPHPEIKPTTLLSPALQVESLFIEPLMLDRLCLAQDESIIHPVLPF